jgi:hypothetical protein
MSHNVVQLGQGLKIFLVTLQHFAPQVALTYPGSPAYFRFKEPKMPVGATHKRIDAIT